MALDKNEVAVGECCLQKARLEKVARSFLDADSPSVIPMRMPTRPEPRHVFGR